MAHKLKMAERLEDQEKKSGSDLEFRVPDVQLAITNKIIDPFLHTYLSLPPAPPLTLDNIFDAVKNVRSWRTLGQHMLYSYFTSKLDDIQRWHASDEACLKAVIEGFLSGEGGRYEQPSWRAVIWSLYQANEIQLAEHIRSFAEPVQGNEFYY